MQWLPATNYVERAWVFRAPTLLVARGGAQVGVAGFAPVFANEIGVLFVNPGDLVEGAPGTAGVIELDGDGAARLARAVGADVARPFAFPWARLRTEEFLRLRDILRGADAGDGLHCWVRRVLQFALADWQRRPIPRLTAHEQRSRFDLAQAMCAFLDRHWRRNVSLAELAGVFGLTSFHLLRVFRRETGLTPHQYAMQLRLRRVLLDLEGAPPLLATVAADAGFSSHGHFSSAFRAAWGLTPQQYAGNLPRRDP